MHATDPPYPTPPVPVDRKAGVQALARALLMATGLVVIYYLLPLDRPFGTGTALTLAAGLLAVAGMLAWQIRIIARSPNPRLRAVETLASTLSLFLLIFAAGYYLMANQSAGSFSSRLSRTDALYFTVTVFSTVGFGDITARSEAARILTTCQMIGDLLLIGVAARVLAGAVQEGLRKQLHEAPPGPPPPGPPAA